MVGERLPSLRGRLQVAPTVTGLVDEFHNMDGILRNKLRSWSMERDTRQSQILVELNKIPKGKRQNESCPSSQNCNGQRRSAKFW